MKHLRIPGSRSLLARILADPSLPERVQSLEAGALAQLIDEVGLEDCGEIVALATIEQLQQIFDHDLWRSQKAGGNESFDPERFGIWLEVLLELGAAQAADKVAQMDPDFVSMAFSQLIWVTSFEDLRSLVAGERGLEKIVDSSYSYELEDFYVFSRQPRSWDATLSILVELDRDHHSFLIGILETCAHFTFEAIEDEGGLSSVLTSEEQLKSDVAFEREKRLEAQGYVTPAEARAFLKLASGSLDVDDHVSPKHFRELKAQSNRPKEPLAEVPAMDLVSSDLQNYARVRAMIQSDPSLQSLRMEELNYLANVLVSGGSIDGRSPRPGEAARLVLKTCETGLIRLEECSTLIEAFRAGWPKSS